VDVAVADFNGDGRDDFVTANYQPGVVAVTLSGGSYTEYQVGGNPGLVEVHDLNGDGRPDLVVESAPPASGTEVDVLLNRGRGNFGAAKKALDAGDQLSVGDVTGDGRPDLVAVNGTDKVAVAVNQGDGAFLPATTYD